MQIYTHHSLHHCVTAKKNQCQLSISFVRALCQLLIFARCLNLSAYLLEHTYLKLAKAWLSSLGNYCIHTGLWKNAGLTCRCTQRQGLQYVGPLWAGNFCSLADRQLWQQWRGLLNQLLQKQHRDDCSLPLFSPSSQSQGWKWLSKTTCDMPV